MADRLTQSEKKTAFNPRKPGQFAGDFNISRMILTSVNSDISADDNAANFIDLTTSNWNELNFYEDIYSPVLSGDITITDTTGIVESFPIIGEEVLEVTFSNVGAAPSSMPDPATALTDLPVEEQEKISFNRYRVYKADPPIAINDNSRTIKLYFVADNQITNMLSRVRRNYPVKQNIDQTNVADSDKVSTLADIARDLFYDFFIGSKRPPRQPKATKEFLVEPTRFTYQMSIPNWTPFRALSFLASKAFSANQETGGANFVFYQTMKGFRFVSIETLMLGGFRGYQQLSRAEALKRHPNLQNNSTPADARADESSFIPVLNPDTYVSPLADPTKKPFVATYKYSAANIGEGVAEKQETVTEFRLVHSVDTMKNLAMGMYANKVITHDLVRMKADQIDFNYIEPPDTLTTKVRDAIVTTKNTDKGDPEKLQVDFTRTAEAGRICSENADMIGRPDAHISLIPTNRGQNFKFSTGPRTQITVDNEGKIQPGGEQEILDADGSPIRQRIEEKHVEDFFAKRISQRRQIDTVKIEFTAPGDSAREVGDLISFDYPSESPRTAETSGVNPGHKYYSGKFLITALRHRITTDEYTIHVEAIKDGYKSEISPGFELKQPKIRIPDPQTGLTDLNVGKTGSRISSDGTRVIGGL